MSFQKNMSVDFGTAKSGLDTVEYQLYNANGTTNGSVVTTGITEIPDGTYTALVTFPNAFQGLIRWSSGEGTPVYASEDVNALDTTLDVLNNLVPGGYAVGSAGYVLGHIGNAAITVQSQVGPGGAITLFEGYDQTITLTDSTDSWPDFAEGDVLTLITNLKKGDYTPFTAVGTVEPLTGTGKVATFALTATQTATLVAGVGKYDLQQTRTADGELVAIAKGGTVTAVAKPG
jgi:hypothetical protein